MRSWKPSRQRGDGVGVTGDDPEPELRPDPNWGWKAWHKYWVEERVRFYEGIGLPRTTLG